MINLYKASAGAGKTHKLTGEYIKLLFESPKAYKHILAVTFTNKATDEMKQRILEELYNLSNPNCKSDYLIQLMELRGKGESWVRSVARNILIEILHDYSSFSISTIDKFFQLIMRAFAREMGKMASYNVELDQDSVLSYAIDNMFLDLDKSENDALLKWLISFSLEEVDNGSSWDIRSDIIVLAKQLFSENFRIINSDKKDFADAQQVGQLKRDLLEIRDKFSKELISLSGRGVLIYKSLGLSASDFKGASKSPFYYLEKTVRGEIGGLSKTFLKLHNNIDAWYTGKNVPRNIEMAYNDGLNDIIGQIISLFARDFRKYSTALELLKNINVLGILGDIYTRVIDYCREKNIILLSESTLLLNRIIDGSDTPFIYERIATWIDNFMLDEFQDTSTLQWKNFYPLLINSMSEGRENLIVGDVKQSIYRWRGSDWQILNSKIGESFREDQIKEYNLNYNWRSGKTIVDFNNLFFEYCANCAQSVYGVEDNQFIKNIYSNFAQITPSKNLDKKSYVSVDFVDIEEYDYNEQALILLKDKIELLLSQGYSCGDIAILVRKSSYGGMAAHFLLSNGYQVVSDDSLSLNSSLSVQKIINVLREIENRDRPIVKVYKYFYGDDLELDEQKLEFIQSLSLYNMCEEIIRTCLTPSDKEDIAFIQAFLDSVLDFTNKWGTNVYQFLEWWDKIGYKICISAPMGRDAIRITTIHKSKGLGFKVVIIPFFIEKLDYSKSIKIWGNFEGSDLDLSFKGPLPLDYGKSLSSTVFEQDYLNEKLCVFVDGINTSYVAFTRAEEVLMIVTPKPKFNKTEHAYSKSYVGDILYDFYLSSVGDSDSSNFLEYGEIPYKGKLDLPKNNSDAIFTGLSESLDMSRLRLSLNTGSLSREDGIREEGIAMHYVFSLINYRSDIKKAVEQAHYMGMTNLSQEELETLVTDKIDSLKEYDWFSSNYLVLNERSILRLDGKELRPDRVLIKKEDSGNSAIIIDYKFGEYMPDSPQFASYIRQMREYKNLLSQMNFVSVQSYIWFVNASKVETL